MANYYKPVIEFDHAPNDPELSFLEGNTFAGTEVTEAEMLEILTFSSNNMSTSWAEPFNQIGGNNATQQTQVSTPAAFNPYPNREHQQAIATEHPYARFMYGHNQTSFQTEPFATNDILINSQNATPQPTLAPTHRESGIPNACCTACNKAKVRKGGCVKLPGGGCERCERKGIQCIPKYRSYPTNRAKVNTSAKAQRKKLERPSS